MKLSIRDNVKCRRLINSEFYRKHWGNLFYFSDDQNAKTRFENSKFGYKSITSVGANTTGDGGDVIMIDDPSDAGEILSDVKKEAVIDWFDGTMSSRANNINDAIWVLIMQRLDEKDLTGHLLKSGKWEHLSIPMEYEGDKKVTCLGWEDPRSELGELMWPEKFDEKSISAMKAQMNPYSYAGQMQQRPVPREGGLIKLSEIKYYKELPEVKRYYWSWDLAVKTGQYNDYSVGQYWAECENGHYLVYMFRQKVEYPTLRQHLKMLCEQYRASEVLIEEKSSGEPLIQELKKHSSLPIISIIPGRDIPGSKEERVIMCSPLFEAGKIYIPEKAEWISGLVEEWVRFPKSAHDDTVDAMSQYLCRRIKKGSSMNKKVVIIG
jgi:predicted phage terminase large subunit-like protein